MGIFRLDVGIRGAAVVRLGKFKLPRKDVNDRAPYVVAIMDKCDVFWVRDIGDFYLLVATSDLFDDDDVPDLLVEYIPEYVWDNGLPERISS